MLDFGALPPEINSGRMYSGPGSGPMLAAAAAWDALAATLSTAAAGCASIVSELASYGWRGPASLAMTTAAAPYLGWLHGTAAQAEHTAAQAQMAAAAYELAFAATVPPPVIAANRSLLTGLVATNFFGQNTPAIAATEAHYAEMWLQDAAAMYGYAGSSQAASRLAPFTAPPHTTDPAGLAAQSSAVGNAAGHPAASPSTTPTQLIPTMPTALQQLATPSVAADPLSASTLLVTGFAATKVVNTVMSTTSSVVSGRGILIVDERLAAGEEPAAEDQGAQLAKTTVSTASAGMGRAALVGQLSVPTGWATAVPGIRPAALALPIPAEAPVEMAEVPASGSMFSQSVLGTLSRDGPDRPRHRSKPIIVRSPAAG